MVAVLAQLEDPAEAAVVAGVDVDELALMFHVQYIYRINRGAECPIVKFTVPHTAAQCSGVDGVFYRSI